MEHLPSGCALGRAQGGDAAWPAEVHVLREVEHNQRMRAWNEGGKSGKPPERLPLPRAVGEVEAEQATLSARAAAHARRQARRAQA